MVAEPRRPLAVMYLQRNQRDYPNTIYLVEVALNTNPSNAGPEKVLSRNVVVKRSQVSNSVVVNS